MPIPQGPALFRPAVLGKLLRARRNHPDPEQRPITFKNLEYVFHDKDLRRQHGLMCRVCLRFHRCVKGPQQGFGCLAYWLWSEQSTQENLHHKRALLAQLPLVAAALTPLTPEELLGVFYVQRYNFGTVVDFSVAGLRQRLLQIGEENSPYLLTTE